MIFSIIDELSEWITLNKDIYKVFALCFTILPILETNRASAIGQKTENHVYVMFKNDVLKRITLCYFVRLNRRLHILKIHVIR